MVIVDGQQRLTTFTLISSVLYKKIDKLTEPLNKKLSKIKSSKIASNEDDCELLISAYDSLINDLDNTAGILSNICLFEGKSNKGKNYPRIIRAYEDCWSFDEEYSKYNSPVSRVLSDVNDPISKLPVELSDGMKEIQKSIDSTIQKEAFNDKLHDDNNLFGQYISSKMTEYGVTLKDQFSEYHYDFIQALKYLYLSEFIINRCAFTFITVTNEDYAYDIFQALNTTGEPLSPIETFKPVVVKYVGVENYKKSEEYQLFEKIDDLLNNTKFKKNTSFFNKGINNLGYLFIGNSVSKALKEQRQMFINAYTTIEEDDVDNKLLFVRVIKETLEFMDLLENDKGSTSDDILELDSEHSLYLRFLYKEHQIVIPLLSYIYFNDRENFSRAISKVTMFALMWRINSGQTNKIDTVYKNYYKNNIYNISYSSLSYHLDIDLEEKIISSDNWIESSQYVLSYDLAQQYFKLAFCILLSEKCPEILCTASFENIKCLKEKNNKAHFNLFPLVSEKASKEKYLSIGNVGIIPSKFNTLDVSKISNFIENDDLYPHYVSGDYTPKDPVSISEYYLYSTSLSLMSKYEHHVTNSNDVEVFITNRSNSFLTSIISSLMSKGKFQFN